MTTVNAPRRGATRTPEQTAGLLTAIAILTAMIGILILNLPPYARLVRGAIATAFGFSIWIWLAYLLATVLLLGVQSAEVRPILLMNPDVDKYARVKWLSLVAYALDLLLGWFAWPPVADLSRWWVTKSLADVNFINVIMIVCTVYGFSWLAAQLKKLSKDLA